MGDYPIPTSFNIFDLKPPPATIPYVHIENIQSLLCVTYIANVQDRLQQSHSGWYVNVYPWLLWKRGKPVPITKVFEGPRGMFIPLDERVLRALNKKAGELKEGGYQRLQKQYDIRCNLLRELKINVKKANHPSF